MYKENDEWFIQSLYNGKDINFCKSEETTHCTLEEMVSVLKSL